MNKRILTLIFLLAAAYGYSQTQYPPASGTVGVGGSGGGGGSVTSVSGGTTGITVANPTTTPTLGGTLKNANGGTGTSTVFTSGSIVFSTSTGVYFQDNSNLFWDDTNHRLGIGTNAPGVTLSVNDISAVLDLIATSGTSYMEFIGPNTHHTWDFGRELIGSDIGLEWYDVTGGTNKDQMSLSQVGDLKLMGLISASSTTINGVAYTWPGTQGGSSTCLQNNGSGALTWTSCGTTYTAGTGLTLTSTAFSLTAPVTPALGGSGTTTAFTAGSVVFSGASGVYTQDNAAFFWDDTHARLGIGTAAPGNRLTISAATSATVDFGLFSTGGTTEELFFNLSSNHGYALGNDPTTNTDGTADSFFWYNYTTAANAYSIRGSDSRVHLYGPMLVDGASTQTGNVIMSGNLQVTTGTTALGTTTGTGTQVYRCSGGTDAGWILYGNSGAAQTLCTGGGGSLVATGVYLP